jgi:hypothetical protein
MGVLAVLAVIAAACTDPANIARGPSTDDVALGPTVVAPTAPERPTLPPLPRPTTTPPPTPPVTVLVVGNMTGCGERDDDVAALVDRTNGPVLSTGDLAPDGTQANITDCFLPLYGDDLDRLYIVPGDADLATDNGGPFFDLVDRTPTGSDRGKGWFVTTLGPWQIIGLTSRCADVGGCGEGSEQYQWLDAVLRDQPNECRLAMWHDPRFTSAKDLDDATDLGPILGRLDGAGTDVVVTGGPANYERLGPLRPNGDRAEIGVMHFNVGTGGTDPTEFDHPHQGSRVKLDQVDGVLSLELSADGYRWEFIATPESLERTGSSSTDSGSGTC